MNEQAATSNAEPAAEPFDPSVVVLYCQRCLADGDMPPQRPAGTDNMSVRLKMTPCSSKIELWHLLQIVDDGADGVELVCCPEKACQFLTGNDRAEKRTERARALLESIDMGAERIGLSRGANLTEQDLLTRARGRADAVRPLGVNPMRKVEQQ